MAFCCTPECDTEIKPGSKLDHCTNCRASMGMWKRRGIRAILARRSRLKKYDSRMEMLVGPKVVKAKAKQA
jgi:hypothetical protein